MSTAWNRRIGISAIMKVIRARSIGRNGPDLLSRNLMVSLTMGCFVLGEGWI